MKKILALVAAASLALVMAPGLGSAAALTCIAPPTPIQKPLPVVPVSPILSWTQPGPCATGVEFVSIAPACPAAIGPAPGEYCGPVIPPGGFSICQWLPAPGTNPNTVTVYAGYDYNGNGHIFLALDGETPVYGPMAPFISWLVPNVAPIPGRVIAYPTNAVGIGPALGGVLLTCV